MKRSFAAALAALAFCSALSAQSKTQVGAEFAYLDGTEFVVKTQDGTTWDYKKGGIVEGDLIPVGSVVSTGPKTQAELRLLPNKSVVKIGKSTTFKIERLAATDSQKINSFLVNLGKVRVVAAILVGDESFRVRSLSAVCAVRGTDFSFSVPSSGKERLVVSRGAVDFSRLAAGVEDQLSRVQVLPGQYADAQADGAFRAFRAGESVISEAFADMRFVKLKEDDVPGHKESSSIAAGPSPLPSGEPGKPVLAVASPASSAPPAATSAPSGSPATAPLATQAPAVAQASPQASPAALAVAATVAASPSVPAPSAAPPIPPTPVPASTPETTPVAVAASSPPPLDVAPAASASASDAPPPADTPAGEPAGGNDKPKPPKGKEGGSSSSAFMEWLSDFLNAEIGTILIDSDVWAKAVVQPTLRLGKFSAGLYLPIIYHENLFDPEDWYHPAGNDEWSFGSDVGWRADTIGALSDAVSDLMLKIKFVSYGDQNFDPFFFKVGNVSDLTLGHGILMQGYANDAEFPARRRVGADLGFGLNGSGKFGIEALANDLSAPEIFGLRAALGLGGKMSLGLSAVADLKPAGMLNAEGSNAAAEAVGDPVFTGMALDADIPIIGMDAFALKAFADVGAIVPIVRNDYAIGANAVSDGFKYEVLWDAESNLPRNYGAVAGVMGKIARYFNYRAELRYSTGNFTQNFFNKSYDANRGEIAANYAAFLADPASDSFVDTLGVYGEGGFSFFKDKLSLSIGYLWPWAAESGLDPVAQAGVLSSDTLRASFIIKKGLIPLVDVSGSVSYERTGFASALMSDSGSADLLSLLFDENTSFRGEIVLPVPKAPMLDLALMFSTSVERDANGQIVFSDAEGRRPRMVPVISLETRLHF
jgi:hypothetical protein